jgi:hypothetical protein
MSEANVDLVRRWFEGPQRGELSPEVCDEEIVVRNWDESLVRRPYHGHAGLRQWWADFADAPDRKPLSPRQTQAPRRA